LIVASFHTISSPEFLRKLENELNTAIPNPDSATLDWRKLEQLPYLSACIQEGVRLSVGVSSRLARIDPKDSIAYGDWVIPRETPVSMTHLHIFQDATIFPEPDRFHPERWLGEPKAPNGQPLNKYFVPFAKDARQCLGIKSVFAISRLL
jgi:cytochrome P450